MKILIKHPTGTPFFVPFASPPGALLSLYSVVYDFIILSIQQALKQKSKEEEWAGEYVLLYSTSTTSLALSLFPFYLFPFPFLFIFLTGDSCCGFYPFYSYTIKLTSFSYTNINFFRASLFLFLYFLWEMGRSKYNLFKKFKMNYTGVGDEIDFLYKKWC